MTKALFKLLICTNLCKRRLFEVTVSVSSLSHCLVAHFRAQNLRKIKEKEIFTFDCSEGVVSHRTCTHIMVYS